METKVFNVVILDKSGSMGSIARQAVDGVNETFGGIRASAERKPEVQQLVTLVVFCGCETRMIYENTPIAEVRNLTPDDYRPCCMTPLYDAIGNTITRLHNHVGSDSDAMVSVTIVTDGYENASKEFSGKAITALIDAYKAEGWMFAYIGTDHDVERVARDMHIDNTMRFEKTEEGTAQMFARRRMSQAQWEEDMYRAMYDPNMSAEAKKRFMRERSSRYFNDEDQE